MNVFEVVLCFAPFFTLHVSEIGFGLSRYSFYSVFDDERIHSLWRIGKILHVATILSQILYLR